MFLRTIGGTTVGLAFCFVLLCLVGFQASADNWGISITPGGTGFYYGSGHGGLYYQTPPVYYTQPVPMYTNPYYPSYYRPYNPVVRRDVSSGGGYAPDGTFHGETRVEDRRASYYSPGRNQAITPPQTRVYQYYNPDGSLSSQEHTSWIGADGRPHSTTINQNTQQDIWGNTHTDTHVTLKKKSTGSAAPSANAEQK